MSSVSLSAVELGANRLQDVLSDGSAVLEIVE